MNKYTFLIQENEKTPNGKIVSYTSIEDVANFITNHNYSSGHYLTGRRSDSMLAQTQTIILDIDCEQPNKKSITDIKALFKSYNHIIAPTKSHRKIKNGICCDRYRILLFTSSPILNSVDYKKVVASLCNQFELAADTKCFNVSHFFYKSSSVYSKNCHGLFLDTTCLIKKTLESNTNQYSNNAFEYRKAYIEIPTKLDSWIQSFDSRPIKMKREYFIRILMAQNNLIRNHPITGQAIGRGSNFIPQEHLSKYLNVSRKTLSQWIKSLIKIGQLEITNGRYGKGYKGVEYRAKDQLLESISANYFQKNKIELPSHIKDGEWEEILIHVSWYFSLDLNHERFYAWASSLPTFHLKEDRKIKVKRAWESMKKKKNEMDGESH